jgi:hypothetical protein
MGFGWINTIGMAPVGPTETVWSGPSMLWLT